MHDRQSEDGWTVSGHISRNKETIYDIIEKDMLTGFVQPVCAAADGAEFGYEALSRFVSHAGAGVPDIQGLFVLACKSNAIARLDAYCRRKAVERAAMLGIALDASFLFINICPEVLMDPEHHSGETDLLVSQAGLRRDRIVLEINESSAIHDYGLFCRAVDYYRRRGYQIAIDDFGVGYGGFKMLYAINPDFVKIDRHFISGIDSDAAKQDIVESVLSLCRKLRIRTVCEGIERQQELETLRAMGADLVQGYLTGRPGLGRIGNDRLCQAHASRAGLMDAMMPAGVPSVAGMAGNAA